MIMVSRIIAKEQSSSKRVELGLEKALKHSRKGEDITKQTKRLSKIPTTMISAPLPISAWPSALLRELLGDLKLSYSSFQRVSGSLLVNVNFLK